MALTDLQIKNLKPKKERYEVTDGKGLSIRVKPTGDKSWFYRYMFKDKPRKMTLGDYPGISLQDARIKHNEAIKKVQCGIDPGIEAKVAKAKWKAEPTFQDLLDEFWDKELSKTPSCKERKRLVDKDIIPVWKRIKVGDIKRRDAVLLIDKVRERAPITANRLQGVLIRMFNFASEKGIIDVSPLAGMRRGKESSRSRTLTDEEIKNLWNCLALERTDIDIYRLTKLALKAILLTGQRPGEVAGMLWTEIEGEWWIIPKERRKGDEENKVPILPMMADVIEQAKIYSSNSRYVFRSSHSKEPPLEESPVTVGALANAIRRHSEEMKINERFTPHDLRRTLRTRLAEVGISDIVSERLLGHKLPGILGIYNRHGYDIEKRQALSLWEKRLCEILGLTETISNVIPFEVQNG